MTNPIHRFLLLALLLGVPADLHAQNSSSYPIAVLPFVERGKETKDLGPKVTELLFANLASDTHLKLVERQVEDVRKVLDEVQLDLSALANPEQAAKVGHLTGAKLLVTGSIMQVDTTLHIIAKIIGTESGRVLSAHAQANVRDDLSRLVSDLSQQVIETVQKRGDEVVVTVSTFDDRLTALKEKLGGRRLPTVFVQISRQQGCPGTESAAEKELVLFCRELGFPVVDRKSGTSQSADVLIQGEATSVIGLRHGTLISAKVRLDVTALDPRTRLILAVDRQTARAVDLNEQLSQTAALQQAAATIAERLLPKLAQEVEQ